MHSLVVKQHPPNMQNTQNIKTIIDDSTDDSSGDIISII